MNPHLKNLEQARHLSTSGNGKRIREQAKLTLKEVAEHIGVDVKTLRRWESGESMPRGDKAIAWVRALAPDFDAA